MNEALRDHVTSGKFVLTLGTSHILAMVVISEGWAKDDKEAYRMGERPGKPSTWLTGFHGLRNRGLAWHEMPPVKKNGTRDYDNTRPSKIYGLTEAGEAVKTLLMEAGIWQEYVKTLPHMRIAS